MDGLYGYHPQAYDEMLRSGQRLFCVSTDDNHNTMAEDCGLYDSFGGYIMIGARSLTYDGRLMPNFPLAPGKATSRFPS